MFDLAVAFIPRDRFSTAPVSLAALSSHLDQRATLYIADAGYPPQLREELERVAAAHRVATRFLNVGLYSTTNHSWNEIVRASSEPALLYLENDVLVEARCVDELMNALKDRDNDIAAAAVYEADRTSIHFRPSVSEIRSLPGGGYRVILDRGRSMEQEPTEPQTAMPVAIFERHCFAVTRRSVEAIGELDELMFCRTDLDLSVSCHQAGLGAVLVPEARCYLDARLDELDTPFYRYRWDLHRVQRANERLIAKWGLVGYKNTIDHAHQARALLSGLHE